MITHLPKCSPSVSADVENELFLVLLYFGMSWTWSLYSELFIYYILEKADLQYVSFGCKPKRLSYTYNHSFQILFPLVPCALQ